MDIPMIDMALTGANIVKLRTAAGLSVHDLQTIFGFNSPQAIYKWQNGTALPTVDTKWILLLLFAEYLFEKMGPRKNPGPARNQ